RLHDHDGARQRGDEAVPLGEVLLPGRGARRLLADHAAMGGDVVAEPEVLLGIADVDAAAEDGDGRTARLERAAVGRGVDAPGHAKHETEAASAELQALARARQEAPRPAGRSSQRHHLPPRRAGVQRVAPSELPLTRGFHPAPYGRGRLLIAAVEEAVEALPG